MTALIFVLFALVLLDIKFELIKNILWYDSLLHMLGGAFSATVFIYVFSCKWQLFDSKKNFLYTLATIAGLVALVGVTWEFYEFLIDAALGSLAQPSLADTIKDLANDLLGGTITTIMYFLSKLKI